MWCLIVSIPDLCPLSYFDKLPTVKCFRMAGYQSKVRKGTKTRNRYNQAPHLTQDTTWESDKNTNKPHKREPTLLGFFLYINDIVEDISSSVRLFADGTSLYSIVDDPIEAADQLHSDLAKIHRWADTWLVAFNHGKSESILLPRKYNKPYQIPVLMNQTQLPKLTLISTLVSSFQMIALGMNILNWSNQKAWKRIRLVSLQ